MANLSEQGGNKMTNSNHKNAAEMDENRRLQKLLQKAVNAEKAPDILRERIRKMIREK